MGFDCEPKVVRQAKKKLAKTNVSVELADITQLQGKRQIKPSFQ